MFEFLDIINLISSATNFTSAHIAFLLLSLHDFFLPEIILQLCCYYCPFSCTPYYWFPYCINFYAWLVQEIFVALHMCWFFKFTNFPRCFCLWSKPGRKEGSDLPSLCIGGQPRLIFPLTYVLQTSDVLEALYQRCGLKVILGCP